MRDFRLDPGNVEEIALAYRWLTEQPTVDPARSGLIGTCVGGAFALMVAASPQLRDRAAFIFAYAPYSSMWTFARDIASATRASGDGREPWQVDPLTRKVFVHSLTAWLEPGEAERLRRACEDGSGHLDGRGLSADGRAVVSLLTAQGEAEAESGAAPFASPHARAPDRPVSAELPGGRSRPAYHPAARCGRSGGSGWRVAAPACCPGRTGRGALYGDALPAFGSGQRQAAVAAPGLGAGRDVRGRVPNI